MQNSFSWNDIKRNIFKCSTTATSTVGQSNQSMRTTLLHCVRSKGTSFPIKQISVKLNATFIRVLQALPPKVLNNVFSRFGDLIDVYMLPNKNCGYAKYASEASALKAIEVLHSAEICGVKLKVMEAEEPRDPKRKRYDD